MTVIATIGLDEYFMVFRGRLLEYILQRTECNALGVRFCGCWIGLCKWTLAYI